MSVSVDTLAPAVVDCFVTVQFVSSSTTLSSTSCDPYCRFVNPSFRSSSSTTAALRPTTLGMVTIVGDAGAELRGAIDGTAAAGPSVAAATADDERDPAGADVGFTAEPSTATTTQPADKTTTAIAAVIPIHAVVLRPRFGGC